MDLQPFARVIILSLLYLKVCECLRVNPELNRKNEENCNEFARDPYFDIQMVVGKPWRIYYTWNLNLREKCIDMSFKNATPMITQRIWNDMYEYMEQQPSWDAATLHVAMGTARHEMLLFADQGAAGSFVGVPNVVRDGNITPVKRTVPLLKFKVKLLHEGKFLIMMDCQMGVSSLSARADPPPYRAEIGSATAGLNLGDGSSACIKEQNKNELISVE